VRGRGRNLLIAQTHGRRQQPPSVETRTCPRTFLRYPPGGARKHNKKKHLLGMKVWWPPHRLRPDRCRAACQRSSPCPCAGQKAPEHGEAGLPRIRLRRQEKPETTKIAAKYAPLRRPTGNSVQNKGAAQRRPHRLRPTTPTDYRGFGCGRPLRPMRRCSSWKKRAPGKSSRRLTSIATHDVVPVPSGSCETCSGWLQ
jgi:hypothetical protein